MTDITYRDVQSPSADPKPAKRESAFKRFIDRLAEARMEQARREIARYTHLTHENVPKSADLDAPGKAGPCV